MEDQAVDQHFIAVQIHTVVILDFFQPLHDQAVEKHEIVLVDLVDPAVSSKRLHPDQSQIHALPFQPVIGKILL